MGHHHSITDTPILPLEREDETFLSGEASIPSIARPRRSGFVLGGAIVSGGLSTLALYSQHDLGFWLGPGLLFGLLVLLPWCRFCAIGWGDTLAAVGLAPLGYLVAVYLTYHYTGFTLFAGLAGSVIMFLPLLVRSHPRVRCAVATALGVGWSLGLVLAVPFVAYFGGVAVWQICVAYCLCSALEPPET